MKITKKSYKKSEFEGDAKNGVAALLTDYNPKTQQGLVRLNNGDTLAFVAEDNGHVYPFLRKKGSSFYEFKSQVDESEDGKTLYFFRKESRGVAKKDIVAGNDGSVSETELYEKIGATAAEDLIESLQEGHLTQDKNEEVYARVMGKPFDVKTPYDDEATALVTVDDRSIEDVSNDAFGFVVNSIRNAVCAKYGNQTKAQENTLKLLENIDKLINFNADKNPTLKHANEMTELEKEEYRQQAIRFYANNLVGKALADFRNDVANINVKDKEQLSDSDILYLVDMAESFINIEVVLVGNKEQERLRTELKAQLFENISERVKLGDFAELADFLDKEDKEYISKLEEKEAAAVEAGKQIVDEILAKEGLSRISLTKQMRENLYESAKTILLSATLPAEEKADLFNHNLEKSHSKKEVVDIQAKIDEEVRILKDMMNLPQARPLADPRNEKTPYQRKVDPIEIAARAHQWAIKFVMDPENGYFKGYKDRATEPNYMANLRDKAAELRDHVLNLAGLELVDKKEYDAQLKKEHPVSKKILKWGGIGLGALALATGIAGGAITFYPNDKALEDSRNQGRVYAEGFDADHLTVRVNDKETPVSVKVSGLNDFKAGEQKYDRAIHVGAAREGIWHEYTNEKQANAVEKLAQIVAGEAVSEGIVVGRGDRKSGSTVVSTIYPLDGEYAISGDVTAINERQKFVDKLIAEGVSTSQAEELAVIYDRAFKNTVGDKYLDKLYAKDDGKEDPGKDPVEPQDKFDFTKFDYSAIAGTPVTYVGVTTEEDVITREKTEAGNIRILDFADEVSSYKSEAELTAADCNVARYINIEQLFENNEDAALMKDLLGIDEQGEGVFLTPDSFNESSTSNGRRCVNVKGVILTENGEGQYNADYQKFGRVAAKTANSTFNVNDAVVEGVLCATVEGYHSFDMTYTPADKVEAENNKEDEKVF